MHSPKCELEELNGKKEYKAKISWYGERVVRTSYLLHY